MRRKKDWESICQEFYASGLKQSEYCRRMSVQQSTLSKCLRQGMGKGSGFLEISVNPRKEGGEEYRIVLKNNREVRLPVGVGINEEVLRNLIRVCESC